MPQTSLHSTPERLAQSERYRSLLMRGDWRAARRMALRDVAESSDSISRLHGMSDQAFAEWAGGLPDLAFDTLTSAAKLYERERKREEEPYVLGVYESARATVLESLEQFEEALIWHAGAKQSFVDAECELYAAAVVNNASFLQTRMGRAKEAIEPLEWAASVFKRHGDLWMLAEAHDSLSLAYRAAGEVMGGVEGK